MSGNERANGPDEVGSGGLSPAEFVERLGRGEHPRYAIMKPVPNTMPIPDDADEWIETFGRVLAHQEQQA
ncbi:hypothetical protein ACIPK5_30460 [Streptomyces sp. NPDC086843]|uniref:hypothetical protein n=1 Tax=Streptomyces sp. NPDC086843 TaxID=3365763 RepID=UPI0038042ACC